MNFEEIKKLLDSEEVEDKLIPSKISDLKKSAMPIQQVRRKMKIEIFMQLVVFLLFFSLPQFVELEELPRSVYYLFVFVTCLITLGLLLKMAWFLKKTTILSRNSREAVLSYLHDLKIILEVYKTAVVAGSLLLPFILLALVLGSASHEQDLFKNLFLLNLPTGTLLLYMAGYIVTAVLIYYATDLWTDKFYGVHIKQLENILGQLEEE